MPRRRSFQDLVSLMRYAGERSEQGRGGALSSWVKQRALNSALRIQASKSYSKELDKYFAATTRAEKDKLGERMTSRKYSARTYYGLANG